MIDKNVDPIKYNSLAEFFTYIPTYAGRRDIYKSDYPCDIEVSSGFDFKIYGFIERTPPSEFRRFDTKYLMPFLGGEVDEEIDFIFACSGLDDES